MINDCAYVGETLLKYFPAELKGWQIKRSRGLWSKTFGLAYDILRARGDIYHAHYLLQDCYIAERLGKKPIIGHAHGSDLRLSLKHPAWGRIVRSNLKKCDRILVSTPDILEEARRFRADAEYLPNPFDRGLFYPKPIENHERKSVLIASDLNWSVKGTDVAIRALSKIKNELEIHVIRHGLDFERTLSLAKKLGLRLNILPKVPHEKLNQYFWNADIIIDQFKLGSLGVASLEAIASGRPVITYVSSEYDEYRDFPIKDVNEEEEIASLVKEADIELWRREHSYLEKNHSLELIIRILLRVYREVSG